MSSPLPAIESMISSIGASGWGVLTQIQGLSRNFSVTERTVMLTHPLTRSEAHGRRGAREEMPRILIVDDDASAADTLASLLQGMGYGEARVAYSGAAALALAAEFVPTVALVDLELPDMSGYDLARQLSQHPQLHTLRLIALTADSEHPGRELAREAGVERYLSKPVSSVELAELFT